MLSATNNPRNLGNLKFGSDTTFHYTIKNEGSQAVEVPSLAIDCSPCTKASMNKGSLQPGETADVQVTFTPGSTGLVRKGLTIIYKDVSALPGVLEQNLRLTFSALVS
jgi:hypothetical protein